MASISNAHRIAPSFLGASSAGTPPARITIELCDQNTIKVFEIFKTELDPCKYYEKEPYMQAWTMGMAARVFISSLEGLMENPTTKASATIATALFNPLFTKGPAFQAYHWTELDGFLDTFLSGAACLERQDSPGSASSSPSTVRIPSPEADRSSVTTRSPLTTSPNEEVIEEEISSSDDAPPEVPEEDINEYPDEFEPEFSLPARAQRT
ncbi:MAG: hypothetical protein NTX49_07250 [Chlamydiae bacterium]|nr:hypothetical protein [Chlamydiota bacterium]